MATYSPSKITKDGNTYNFTDDTKIPLAGTSALAGSIVPSTNNAYDLGSTSYRFRNGIIDNIYSNNLVNTKNNGALNIWGGSAWNTGAMAVFFGKDESTNPNAFIIRSFNSNNTGWFDLRGTSSGTLSWNGSAIVTSSDYRLKDEIESISDDVLNAWENLEPKQYKLKSDLETDKENAQVHYGWIAQDIESIIKGNRKGEIKNGLWLHESWEEQEEVSHEETYTEEVATKSGEKQTVTKTRKVIDQPYREKGDSYGLRYTECLVVECAYLRKKLKELTARIEQLEKGNNVK